jgi:hypothetical protein
MSYITSLRAIANGLNRRGLPTVAPQQITELLRRLRGRQLLLSMPLQRWPDFRKWDQHNEFELDDAVALWFDAEPRSPMWWRARWKLRRLLAAIAAASQQQQYTDGAQPGAASRPHSPIHRDALKRLQIFALQPLLPQCTIKMDGAFDGVAIEREP